MAAAWFWRYKLERKYLLILVPLFLIISAMSIFSNDNTPTVPYKVLKKIGAVEIRAYNPVLYASVEKTGRMMEIGNPGFRDLAGYIFGGNKESKKIAMTAPVTFRAADSSGEKTEMSFSMPQGMTLENIPKPSSGNIRLHLSEPVRLAVLEFGGFASNKNINEKAESLRDILRKENIEWKEPVIFMAYNSPWKLFSRRNEVAFEISENTQLK